MSHEGTAPVSLLEPLICFCRAHGRDRQTDHAKCIATGRIFTLCIAMRPKNYSERQNWRHQLNETKLVRCKRVVVAVGAKLHARDVCSCMSLSVLVYRVRALSAATPIYTSVTVDQQKQMSNRILRTVSSNF